MTSDTMSTGQVARFLGVSNQRVWQLVKSGALACIETPAGRLFERETVARYAEEREAQRAARAAAGESR
jgi:excisionase family DNA binding protein